VGGLCGCPPSSAHSASAAILVSADGPRRPDPRAEPPAGFELSVDADGHVTGTAQLVQSDWGIKPYRGLMGALRVRDSVELVFDGGLAID
jgi:hypothetical protein